MALSIKPTLRFRNVRVLQETLRTHRRDRQNLTGNIRCRFMGRHEEKEVAPSSAGCASRSVNSAEGRHDLRSQRDGEQPDGIGFLLS
jgi:hypothetical protein